jgi:mono/diheme cytochrome c family protein
MKNRLPNSLLLLGSAALVTLIVLLGAPHSTVKHSVSAQEPAAEVQQKQIERLIPSLKGPDLFRAYCAPCHGADGKGGGPVAPALKNRLPDLTTISRRNGGIFPARRVEEIIGGGEIIVGHGSREMPIWGPIFHQVENDRDYGHIRLKNLVDYLKSMQQQ